MPTNSGPTSLTWAKKGTGTLVSLDFSEGSSEPEVMEEAVLPLLPGFTVLS